MFVRIIVFFIVIASAAFAQDWELVWGDEFDYDGLPDPEKWSYEEGYVRNNEKQYYTVERSENARVEDGMLVIESRKEEYEDMDYTSASVHTRDSYHIHYGRVEVRAKLPTGRGMWPAIWMLGANISKVGWPECGELDIMENVGYDPDRVHANVHCEKYNHTKGNGKGHSLIVSAPYENFHIYALEWTEDRVDFYVDDQKHFTYKDEGTGWEAWPFDKPHYLIINAAIGGAWGGQQGIDDSIFPQKYVIDYVRVYEKSTRVNSIPKPTETRLCQAYPNPFNPETTIEYIVDRNMDVDIAVKDVLGRRVKNLVNGEHPAGQYNIVWNGRGESGEQLQSTREDWIYVELKLGHKIPVIDGFVLNKKILL